MSKADLERKLTILKNMSQEQISEPSNMPVAVYIREAEKLVTVGGRDLDKLSQYGFTGEMLADLKVRIGALRQAESLQKMLRFQKGESALEWDRLSARGYGICDSLRATLLFAYRRDRELVRQVRAIGIGKSPQVMIEALKELALLAKSNSTQLKAINFELAELDEAVALAERLGGLLEMAEAERDSGYMRMRLRDAAYSHLKEGLKELRDYGLFVFRGDKKRGLDYTSDYLRKKRNRRKLRALSRGKVGQNELLDAACCGQKSPASGGESSKMGLSSRKSGKELLTKRRERFKVAKGAPDGGAKSSESGRVVQEERAAASKMDRENLKGRKPALIVDRGAPDDGTVGLKRGPGLQEKSREPLKLRMGKPYRCTRALIVRTEASCNGPGGLRAGNELQKLERRQDKRLICAKGQ